VTNLVNLQRDMNFVTLSQSALSWPSTANRLNSDGTVYTDMATANINGTTDASAAGTHCGIMITQPTGDRTPYRVQCSVYGSTAWYLSIGYATSTTGTNDTISGVQYIPGQAGSRTMKIDEIICLDGSSGSDPVFFAIYSAGTSVTYTGHLSVQRLNTVPPTFAAATS
jgi:hypothetical protein